MSATPAPPPTIEAVVPPNDPDAEEALLGAVLIAPEVVGEIEDLVSGDDFYIERHRWIWEAIQRLRAQETAVDIVTVSSALGEHLEAAGGLAYLTKLLARPSTSLHATAYAQIVSEMSLRRRLLRSAEEIAKGAYDTTRDFAQDVLASAEKAVFDVSQRAVGGGDFSPASAIISSIMDRLESGQAQTGMSTGLAELDSLIRLRPADLVVLAGRPGQGKTALLLEIARYAAVRQRVPTAVFSLEMPEESLMERIISQTSGIPLSRIRNSGLSQHDWEMFMETVGVIAESPLYINDTPYLTPISLRSQCLRLASRHEIGLVVIDYLQLMSGSRRYRNRVEEVSEISRSLKLLARELNVPVLAAAQLSRAVEQRQDKRPVLSDLRESGSIEQDSDIVMFVYSGGEETDTLRNVPVEKHRNGPVGTVQLGFTGSTVHFSSLSRTA